MYACHCEVRLNGKNVIFFVKTEVISKILSNFDQLWTLHQLNFTL